VGTFWTKAIIGTVWTQALVGTVWTKAVVGTVWTEAVMGTVWTQAVVACLRLISYYYLGLRKIKYKYICQNISLTVEIWKVKVQYLILNCLVFRPYTMGTSEMVCFQTVNYGRMRSHTKSKHVRGNHDGNKHDLLKLSTL
jgi:hypothetical protein